MSEYNKDALKNQLFKGRVRTLILTFTVIFIVIVLLFSGIWFLKRDQSRRVLKQAKTMHLAVRTIAMEYYSMNKQFSVPETKDGFAEGVSISLKKLSGCTGDVYLHGWDNENQIPQCLVYVEGRYIVVYTYASGTDIWDVYELKQVIVQ